MICPHCKNMDLFYVKDLAYDGGYRLLGFWKCICGYRFYDVVKIGRGRT